MGEPYTYTTSAPAMPACTVADLMAIMAAMPKAPPPKVVLCDPLGFEDIKREVPPAPAHPQPYPPHIYDVTILGVEIVVRDYLPPHTLRLVEESFVTTLDALHARYG